MNQKIYDLVIIGGGASGMMMSAIASEYGAQVILLEKNSSLGKKLKITGGGRCNITNAEFNVKKFLDNFSEAKKFLYSPFSKFSSQDAFNFFEKNGLPLKIEANQRVFPKSERALDVFKTLEKIIKKNNVIIKKNCQIVKISKDANVITTVVLKDGTKFSALNFAIATGGISAPQTGSTGDGFKFLKNLGHTIKKPTPSVVPLTTDNKIFQEISGTTCSFVKVSFLQNEKVQFKKIGKILFTHFGLSAPLILNSSYQVKKLLEKGSVVAAIDLFPDTELNDLDRRLWRLFEKNKNKLIKNVLPELINKKIAGALLKSFPEDFSEKEINNISKKERKDLVQEMKNIRINIKGTLGIDKAVITDGGLILEEVNFSNMTSKKFSNLYILGDILNINRPSGGFSLQLCWTTGFVAGQDFLNKMRINK